ncbi:MAG: YhbY family RNA-binding protein [Bacilli bacterium]|nr:YhbY family RNA-binding protein [Bacilli bacterium]
MLTNKNKKQLKALANTSTHKYQIGKGAVDASVVALLNNALKAHELIKVYFNRSITSEMAKLTDEIIIATQCELVTTIGHSIVLYKANPNKKDRIILN